MRSPTKLRHCLFGVAFVLLQAQDAAGETSLRDVLTAELGADGQARLEYVGGDQVARLVIREARLELAALLTRHTGTIVERVVFERREGETSVYRIELRDPRVSVTLDVDSSTRKMELGFTPMLVPPPPEGAPLRSARQDAVYARAVIADLVADAKPSAATGLGPAIARLTRELRFEEIIATWEGRSDGSKVSLETRTLVALAYFEIGAWDQAEREILGVLRARKEPRPDPTLSRALVRVYLATGNLPRARVVLSSLFAHTPRDAELVRLQARERLLSNEPTAALDLLGSIAAPAGDPWREHELLRAEAFFALAQGEAAANTYAGALEALAAGPIDPHHLGERLVGVCARSCSAATKARFLGAVSHARPELLKSPRASYLLGVQPVADTSIWSQLGAL